MLVLYARGVAIANVGVSVSAPVAIKTFRFDNANDFDYEYDFWYDHIRDTSSQIRCRVKSHGRPPFYYAENCCRSCCQYFKFKVKKLYT